MGPRGPRNAITPHMLQNAIGNLNRTDYGVASSNHDQMHVRRNVGQTSTEFVDFMRSTRTGLATLDSQAVGHRMLSDLNAGTNPDLDIAGNQLASTNVHFRESVANSADYHHPGGDVTNSPAYRRGGVDGGGNVTSTVNWNPNLNTSDGTHRPAFIGLGHELAHSWRAMEGTAVRRNFPGPALRGRLGPILRDRDELETVGLHATPRHVNAPTENALRNEHGVTARNSYSGRTQATLRTDIANTVLPNTPVRRRMAHELFQRIR